jgi:hypothetical protein
MVASRCRATQVRPDRCGRLYASAPTAARRGAKKKQTDRRTDLLTQKVHPMLETVIVVLLVLWLLGLVTSTTLGGFIHVLLVLALVVIVLRVISGRRV